MLVHFVVGSGVQRLQSRSGRVGKECQPGGHSRERSTQPGCGSHIHIATRAVTATPRVANAHFTVRSAPWVNSSDMMSSVAT